MKPWPCYPNYLFFLEFFHPILFYPIPYFFNYGRIKNTTWRDYQSVKVDQLGTDISFGLCIN